MPAHNTLFSRLLPALVAALVLATLAAQAPKPPSAGGAPNVQPAPPASPNAQSAQMSQNLSPVNQAGGKGRPGSVSKIPTDPLTVKTVDLPDGRKGWSVEIPGGRPLATPAVVNGMAYVGGGFGSYEFYAFDALTGRPAWAIRVSDDGPTAAVVADGCVVFNTESCTLFVVDAKTGDMIWSRWLGDPLMSQPAVRDGRIFMAYPGEGGKHRLVALGLKTGKEFWNVPIEGDLISAPVVGGDRVYLTTFDGTCYAYRAATGEKVWAEAQKATSAPWVSGGKVYVSLRVDGKPGDAGKPPREGQGELDKDAGKKVGVNDLTVREAVYIDAGVQARSSYSVAQHANDASVGFSTAPANAKVGAAASNIGQGTVHGLWEYQGSRPTVASGVNYACMGDRLQAVDLASGKVLWQSDWKADMARIGGHFLTPPAVVGDRVFLGTAKGEIQVLERSSGKTLWTWDAGQPVRFQPAVVKGRIYAGTAGGRLVCLDTGDPKADGWTMWGGGPAHNGPETGCADCSVECGAQASGAPL
ncbi:MAG: PQQ-binding-like beta-propeller repeat protein [Acidobacteria bacterium]|nr:PQQ-binding-like beta-propeller repeat protein [Acidobacteriota bacterium]